MYMNRYPIVGMIDTSGKHVDTKYCTVVLSFTCVCCVLCLLPSAVVMDTSYLISIHYTIDAFGTL